MECPSYIHLSPVVDGEAVAFARCVWLNTLAHDPRAVSESTMELEE